MTNPPHYNYYPRIIFITFKSQTIFVEILKIYLMLSPYFNIILHGKFALCVAIYRGEMLLTFNALRFIID